MYLNIKIFKLLKHFENFIILKFYENLEFVFKFLKFWNILNI